MASPQIHFSPRHNFLPGGKDEFIRGALTKSSNTNILIPAVLCTHIPTLAFTLPFTYKLLKQFIKAYLKNQN